tara:strand:- start:2331 stop:3275 length:945 start_codon:yes stop_codon:yes gene_type:complete
MMDLQFVFNGGLGNQIFQFLASKYILEEVRNIKINYALSEYILNGGRNFELNNLLKSPLDITKEYNQYFEKIYNKIINNSFFLKQTQRDKIKFKFNLKNKLYYEKNINNTFLDSIQDLSKDLNLLTNNFSKLKIKGYWQNPSCYLENIDTYSKYFLNTKKFLPSGIKANQYITIHIRRGDYFLSKESTLHFYSKFSPVQFIILSLKILPKEYLNYPIYLISDDIHWRNNLIDILSNSFQNKLRFINTINHFEDWSLIRHASINICSNSTFSYSAALLNNDNRGNKLRCIVPQWINNETTAFQKGWLNPPGFIEI